MFKILRLNSYSTLFFAFVILNFFLNLYHIDRYPPGLYIDEVALGYNAYTLLTKGTDEYGIKYPVFFKSFGDYKPPVYIYLDVLPLKIFGKNEFAVRFPSAFLGSLALIIFNFLVESLLVLDGKKKSVARKFALLSSIILATSPWYMQFVGPAFETTVALFLFIMATYLIIIFVKRNQSIALYTSIFFYSLTIFTYHSYRIITPLIAGYLLFKLSKRIVDKKKLFAFYGCLVLCIIPILFSYFSATGRIRFLQTSAFPQPAPLNWPFLYSFIFVKNYFSYFSSHFLFNFGDGIARHQLPHFGPLARWELPFLIAGFFLLAHKNRSLLKRAIIAMFIIAPLASSFSLPSPHTLRSLSMSLPYCVTITLGIVFLLRLFKKYQSIVIIIIVVIYTFELSYFLHFDLVHYPKTNLIDWGGNYKEVVNQMEILGKSYPVVAVYNSLNYANIYVHFYNDHLTPIYVGAKWLMANSKPAKHMLLVTSETGSLVAPQSAKLIHQVYLSNDNHDVFAQFWEL